MRPKCRASTSMTSCTLQLASVSHHGCHSIAACVVCTLNDFDRVDVDIALGLSVDSESSVDRESIRSSGPSDSLLQT